MSISQKAFEQEARARITRFLDQRGYASHEAREQDERAFLAAVGLASTDDALAEQIDQPPVAFDEGGTFTL